MYQVAFTQCWVLALYPLHCLVPFAPFRSLSSLALLQSRTSCKTRCPRPSRICSLLASLFGFLPGTNRKLPLISVSIFNWERVKSLVLWCRSTRLATHSWDGWVGHTPGDYGVIIYPSATSLALRLSVKRVLEAAFTRDGLSWHHQQLSGDDSWIGSTPRSPVPVCNNI